MHEIAAEGSALAVPRALWGSGRGLKVDQLAPLPAGLSRGAPFVRPNSGHCAGIAKAIEAEMSAEMWACAISADFAVKVVC